MLFGIYVQEIRALHMGNFPPFQLVARLRIVLECLRPRYMSLL